jgi:ABC-type transport system substrate-binding protein
MKRRSLLKGSAAGLAVHPVPHIASAQALSTLKFKPNTDLTILDPVWTTAYSSRYLGLLSYDMLFNPAGSMGIMRFNHLHPPFNNAAIRRAVLGAINQDEVGTAVTGNDRTQWDDNVGVFCPNSPMASEAGLEVLTSARDDDKVKHDLAAAG